MTGSSSAQPAFVVWALTRALLLLCVIKVIMLPGPDVTSDVSVIYQGWYDVLRSGSYPQSDVTWQYPPLAALAILSPALLPFLDYASAFFVLAFLCDALVLGLLLYAGRGTARRTAGAWVWVAGVPLLGTTAYARYDVMVTAVAVAALLAGVRHPRVLGALAAVGALLKVWWRCCSPVRLAGAGRAWRGRPRPGRRSGCWRCALWRRPARWPFSVSSATGAPRSSRWVRWSSMWRGSSAGRAGWSCITARWSSWARACRW